MKRNRRGLTLIEILVAAGLSSIIAAGMITALSQAASKTSLSKQTASLAEDLRRSLDLISARGQSASRLYRSDDAGLTGITVIGATGVQPILGLMAPRLTTTDPNDYAFGLFYLADPLADVYRGPKVLYYAEAALALPARPLPTGTLPALPASVTDGRVVADYLATQDLQNRANFFKPDSSNGNKSGILYLQSTSQNLPSATAPVLSLQVRITARN